MYAVMHVIPDITLEKFSSFRKEAQNCLGVDAPEPVHYQKLDNPYLAKLG